MSGLGFKSTPGSSKGAASIIVAATDAPAIVKARADYVCDGVDDQVEINQALALGSVQLTDGIFNITAPVRIINSGTVLAGTAAGDHNQNGTGLKRGTDLKLVTGFVGEAAVLVQENANTYPLAAPTVRDLSIRGGTIGTGVNGIVLRAYNALISRVLVARMTGNGIVVRGYTTPHWATYETMIQQVVINHCAGDGLRSEYGAEDLHIMNLISFSNVGSGVALAGGASWQLTGFHVYGNDQYGIHFAGAGSRTKISNGKIEHQKKHGIFHDGTVAGVAGVQISGCGFQGNGRLTTGTYDHINLSGTGAPWGFRISNCDFGNDYNNANKPRHAVFMASQARHSRVHDCTVNTFAHSTATAFNISSSATGCLEYDNYVYSA